MYRWMHSIRREPAGDIKIALLASSTDVDIGSGCSPTPRMMACRGSFAAIFRLGTESRLNEAPRAADATRVRRLSIFS